MKNFRVLLFFLILSSCSRETKGPCRNQIMQKVNFLHDSVQIQFPQQWSKIDSSFFRSDGLLYSRNIMNEDTSSFAYLSAYDYGEYSQVILAPELYFKSFGPIVDHIDLSSLKILDSTLMKVNGYEVKFLKYVHNVDNEKVVEGRIGFILPEKKQVEIFVRIFDTKNEAEKELDCIFSTLQLK